MCTIATKTLRLRVKDRHAAAPAPNGQGSQRRLELLQPSEQRPLAKAPTESDRLRPQQALHRQHHRIRAHRRQHHSGSRAGLRKQAQDSRKKPPPLACLQSAGIASTPSAGCPSRLAPPRSGTTPFVSPATVSESGTPTDWTTMPSSAGCFVEDACGRWYFCITVKIEPANQHRRPACRH